MTTYTSVWDALEDTKEAADAKKLRSALMRAVAAEIAGWGLTQRAAAARLRLTQPRLNELLTGKFSRFSFEALLNIAQRAEMTVHLTVARGGGKVARAATSGRVRAKAEAAHA